jgi:serine/threonine protein kinase
MPKSPKGDQKTSAKEVITFKENRELSLDDLNEVYNDIDYNNSVFPGYHVVSSVSRGGFGQVSIATRISDGASFAMKIATPQDYQTNFLLSDDSIREIDFLMRFNHPNVSHGVDFNIYRKHMTSSIVMPYIPTTWAHFIKETQIRNNVSTELRLSVFRKVLCGIQYLHSNGVCHLDLKPENVLMDKFFQEVKVTDFGSSRNGFEFINGGYGFTREYSPPESWIWTKNSGEGRYLACPRIVDGSKMDVYALGLLGIEMVFDIRPPSVYLSPKDPDVLSYLALMVLGFSNHVKVVSDSDDAPLDDNQRNIIRDLKKAYRGNGFAYEHSSELMAYFLGMSQPPPLKRPTTESLMKKFPNEYLSPRDQSVCEISKIHIEESDIKFTDIYSHSKRKGYISIIVKLHKEYFPTLSLYAKDDASMKKSLVCSIDLLDRLGDFTASLILNFSPLGKIACPEFTLPTYHSTVLSVTLPQSSISTSKLDSMSSSALHPDTFTSLSVSKSVIFNFFRYFSPVILSTLPFTHLTSSSCTCICIGSSRPSNDRSTAFLREIFMYTLSILALWK